MADPTLTKDPVSLEDLKQAIADVPARPDINAPDWVIQMKAYYRQKAEAWRLAFEYLAQFHQPGSYIKGSNLDQVMTLIREKLK